MLTSLHLDQHRVSVRLNLSTYGGALADPEYLRMVVPQFVHRKNVANLCVRFRASEAEQMNALLQTVGLYCCCPGHSFGISVSGKGRIRLRRRKKKPITSIRWTTQFVRVRRISDLVEDINGKCITNQPFSKFCPS